MNRKITRITRSYMAAANDAISSLEYSRRQVLPGYLVCSYITFLHNKSHHNLSLQWHTSAQVPFWHLNVSFLLPSFFILADYYVPETTALVGNGRVSLKIKRSLIRFPIQWLSGG